MQMILAQTEQEETSGTEQCLQLSTSAVENSAHVPQRDSTLTTCPDPSPSFISSPKMSFSSTLHPLKPGSPQAAAGLLWEQCWGAEAGNGCLFVSITFSKGSNCCIWNYIRLQEQRCPLDAL